MDGDDDLCFPAGSLLCSTRFRLKGLQPIVRAFRGRSNDALLVWTKRSGGSSRSVDEGVVSWTTCRGTRGDFEGRNGL
jgi:hypothetical protein